MDFGFEIKTNKACPMINDAVFGLPDGQTIVVDRDTTEYVAEEIGEGIYRMRMFWRNCYVWDGEKCNYLKSGLSPDVILKLRELELEGDAGEDYHVEVEFCFWDMYSKNDVDCLDDDALPF